MRFTTEQLAGAMYDYLETMLTYDPDCDPVALARQINNGDGFTIDVSEDNKLRGNFVRYEGVRVSDERLVAAYQLAMDWMHPNDPGLAAFMKTHYL